MNKCKSCGEEILWAITDNDKRMPLSVASKERRFIIKPSKLYAELGGDIATMVDTYVNHFDDCPSPEQDRK